MARLVLLVVALVLGAAAAYDCPCSKAPGCRAASPVPPGGLATEAVPFFIVLTVDDAITVVSQPVIFNLTARHTNHNGCRMPATWFVSIDYTDPRLVQQAYIRGGELATHTVHHVGNPNTSEIVGAKLWLNQTAKIPLEDIQGFRAPFLLFSPAQRKALYDNGFMYDSSIGERWNPSNPLSPDAAHRTWPYTLDCGVAQDCSISTGECSATEEWPGLWEFPLYIAQEDNGTVLGSMDTPSQGNLTEVYEREFNARYYGNRAPLGIFIHAARLLAEPERVDQLHAFLDYAMSHEDVFLVTAQQVLDWIQNPVPASQYNPPCPTEEQLLARLPGGKLLCESNATISCGNGVFNTDKCACDCQNEASPQWNGFCRDLTGVCTVPKAWDDSTGSWACPPGSGPTSGAGAGSGSSVVVDPSLGVALGSAQCGHSLVSLNGLFSSGAGSRAALWANGMRAVDGSGATCVSIQPANGKSTLELLVPYTKFSGVQLLAGAEVAATVRIYSGEEVTAVCKATIPANNASLIPCAASGDGITIESSTNMTLCDVYPVPAPDASPSPAASPPPVARTAVVLELDILGMTVDTFNSQGWSSKLCNALLPLIGDSGATCSILSVRVAGRRRLMQASIAAATDSVHVAIEVLTFYPDVARRVFADGNMLASLFSQFSISIDPTSVTISDALAASPSPSSSPAPSEAGAAPVTAPTTPSTSSAGASGGNGSNTGAIVGGVVGGIGGAL